ncbi:hypothetical protein PTKIN_Ptkin10aG0128000 [Pterospermum kingtungense]
MGKPTSRPDSLSKVDKTLKKKAQFHIKVGDTAVNMSAKKNIKKKKKKKKKRRSRRKKLKAFDLSALLDSLPELEAPRKPTPVNLKLNCKSRQRIILKEGKQLCAVIKHPALQADSLAAIHQHLQSTQPVLDEKPKQDIQYLLH